MKFRFKGLDKYITKLENLSNSFNAQACVEIAVDKGAEVVAEMTVAELKNLPEDNKPWATAENKRHGVRSIEKQFLIKEFGVTPLENKNGYINEKTGVDKGTLTYHGHGYTPAVVLARSLERGTSFMDKNPVFSRASRKARKPCLNAMQESLNESITILFNNNQAKLRRSKK